ncbi:MAG: DUF3667 domain-containing protein [Calditrichaeota bacterium]|nr:MAG: DUF3667 domain-containing protein [Calditrichota bacterium]MBL1204423.1 DUF3667 domain-containing protein [Calditrichota bacterium]NOG44252.1 DUF3667 domain-containing protein [Calditrichota bacterium]
METCLNCGKKFEDSFCNHCGQKKITDRITLKSIYLEFLQTVFLFESHLFRTVKELVISPGNYVKTYLKGKRRPFMAPIQFFLLLLTLYVLVFNLFGDKYFEYITQVTRVENSEKIQKFDLNIQNIQTHVKKNLDIFNFMMPPIMALFFWALFRKQGFNYAESLVFSFYIISIGFLLSIIIIFFSLVDIRVAFLKNILLIIYFSFAIIQFSGMKKTPALFKSILTIIFTYMLYGVVVAGFTIIFILLKP